MQRIINKYVVECPWLSGLVDETRLIEKYKNNFRNLQTYSDQTAFQKGRLDSLKMEDYGADCIKIDDTEVITKCLFDKINYNTLWEEPIGWFIHKYDKSIQTKVHTDKKRNGVLIYPIIPKSYTIVYVDKNNHKSEIYRYTYRCPTIINASIPHYVEDLNLEKIHFQISLFINTKDWRKVINE